MEEYIVQASLGLTRGSLLRVEEGRGILVYVWEGEVWLTEDGERRDRILQPGQWHRLERGGATVAYALERSLVTLTAPEPEYYARRIVLTKAGSAAPVELYNAARVRMAWVAALSSRLRRLWAGLYFPQSRPTSAVL